ncbi:MAG: hypothetical protein HW414_928 [Dehalococcoidia bacterium]|nr:hypothetical protein [Dehalococcoidia bacterium]
MQRIISEFRFIVVFTAAFTFSSFLFSFLSWGQAIPKSPGIPQLESDFTGLLVHMGIHAALGALAALPTRRASFILTVSLCAMLIDVDHTGSFLGLPMEGRANHSVLFALVAPLIISTLSYKGFLGKNITPMVGGSLALASVLAHVAFDIISGDPDIPIWSPFTAIPVTIPYFVGILLEIFAFFIVWLTIKRLNREGGAKEIIT